MSGNRAYHYICKPCHNQHMLEWKKTENGKASVRSSQLKCDFGISLDQYSELFYEQGGQCAICGCEETSVTKSGEIKWLAVDHDHETGKIRGLLCHACNIAIGLLKDDVSILQSAINYFRLNKVGTQSVVELMKRGAETS